MSCSRLSDALAQTGKRSTCPMRLSRVGANVSKAVGTGTPGAPMMVAVKGRSRVRTKASMAESRSPAIISRVTLSRPSRNINPPLLP
jgi:hypothetical protein